MCGRARCSLGRAQILAAARIEGQGRWANADRYQPTYNASPGAWIPCVRLGRDGQREVVSMRWGLVPSFTRLAPGERPDFFRMFNARDDGLVTKSVFSRLLPFRRCVVLLDGFYEWHTEAPGRKQPYHLTAAPPDSPGGAMYLAGLYDTYDDGSGGEPTPTCTIITTDSSKPIAWLHDRMPVILTTQEEVAAWLGDGELPGADGAAAAAGAGKEGALGSSDAALSGGMKEGWEADAGASAEGVTGVKEEAEAEAAGHAAEEEGGAGQRPAKRARLLAAPPAGLGASGGGGGGGGGGGSDAAAGSEEGEGEGVVAGEGCGRQKELQLPQAGDWEAAGGGGGGGGGGSQKQSSERGLDGGDDATYQQRLAGAKSKAAGLVAQLCRPYGGPLLRWHPVTPEMSKPGYEKPDAAKDMRSRKGAIGSFFKPQPQPQPQPQQPQPQQQRSSAGGPVPTAAAAAFKAAPAPAPAPAAAACARRGVGVGGVKREQQPEHGASAAATLVTAATEVTAEEAPRQADGADHGRGPGGSQDGAATLASRLEPHQRHQRLSRGDGEPAGPQAAGGHRHSRGPPRQPPAASAEQGAGAGAAACSPAAPSPPDDVVVISDGDEDLEGQEEVVVEGQEEGAVVEGRGGRRHGAASSSAGGGAGSDGPGPVTAQQRTPAAPTTAGAGAGPGAASGGARAAGGGAGGRGTGGAAAPSPRSAAGKVGAGGGKRASPATGGKGGSGKKGAGGAAASRPAPAQKGSLLSCWGLNSK